MARQKITVEERRMVGRFLNDLAASYEGGWDKLMDDAGIPRTTAQGWHYKTPRTTPSGLHMLSLLRTADVLHDAAQEALRRAAALAEEAGDQIGTNGQRAPTDLGKRASNR